MSHFKYTVIIALLTGLSLSASAQQYEDYDYSREFLWGVTKSTNSGLLGGGFLRYNMRVGKDVYQSFGLEVANIKHPRESRTRSITSTGGGYIAGKSNFLFTVRPQYGRSWLLFKKAPQQGVQINVNAIAGPTIGLLSPYFINYWDGNTVVTVPYDPDIHDQNNIQGSSTLFRGLGESAVVAGFHARLSLSFEFGTFKSKVSGVETGIMAEAFAREMVIIPTATNRQVFPSAFVTLYYGSRN